MVLTGWRRSRQIDGMRNSPQSMVVPEKVMTAAKAHVESLRPVNGFVWRLAWGKRVAASWYFDYEAERLPSNPSGPGSGFGYAPGFLVSDEGQSECCDGVICAKS
jgi:hypothetical protein